MCVIQESLQIAVIFLLIGLAAASKYHRIDAYPLFFAFSDRITAEIVDSILCGPLLHTRTSIRSITDQLHTKNNLDSDQTEEALLSSTSKI